LIERLVRNEEVSGLIPLWSKFSAAHSASMPPPRKPLHGRRAVLYFEHAREPLLPHPLFLRRVVWSTSIGFGLLAIALGLGIVGYRVTEKMTWIDAFANASMILSGMGPLGTLQTRAGKLFAGCYALFSGLAFITVTGVILSPFVHRVFHRFHVIDAEASKSEQ